MRRNREDEPRHRHDATFLAIDRGASDWALHRARLADRHGDGAVDRVLATGAAEAQIALAGQQVAAYRRALGRPGLSAAGRRRLDGSLASAAAWLQSAFLTRLALDRSAP